jgi:hypothetical protein
MQDPVGILRIYFKGGFLLLLLACYFDDVEVEGSSDPIYEEAEASGGRYFLGQLVRPLPRWRGYGRGLCREPSHEIATLLVISLLRSHENEAFLVSNLPVCQ